MTATDPTYLGILDAILDAPGDDGPRLVMADWLSENGQEERAEFIRVQVELTATADPHSDRYWDGQLGDGPAQYRRRKSLRRRERALLEGYALYWLAGLHAAIDPERCEYRQESGHVVEFGGALIVLATFRRGFVSHITLTLADFTAHAAEVFAWHPVERVTLADHHPARVRDDLFIWARGPNSHGAPVLPAWLRDRLGSTHSSDSAWREELSDTLVAHGRELARPLREARRRDGFTLRRV